MIRRAFVAPVILVFSLGPAMAGRQTPPAARHDFLVRARKIHAETIGIDSHIDTLQRVLNGKEDISRRTGKGHVDLPRLEEAGMRAPFFALYVRSAIGCHRTWIGIETRSTPPAFVTSIRRSPAVVGTKSKS